MTAQDVLAQHHDIGPRVAFATLELDDRAALATLIGDLADADREAHDLVDHSRALKKIRITYQNMSATDENNASDAATC